MYLIIASLGLAVAWFVLACLRAPKYWYAKPIPKGDWFYNDEKKERG